MKINELAKQVLVPVLSAVFLAALFRPLCMGNGACDYLKLWFFMGIPFGIQWVFVWMIPKGHDFGSSMGILFIHVFVGGVIGGIALTWRLLKAAIYLVKAALSGIAWTIRKAAGKSCRTA